MAKLILVRHGLSEWNAKGLWTGWNDISLNDKGREEAAQAGEALKGMVIDQVFASDLKRAQETYAVIKEVLGTESIPVEITPAIKERNYGELAGKNKWKIKEEYGEEQFMKWRRSWDSPLPGGETLKDVYNRVVPFYTERVLPLLQEGKTVLLASHGNPLRAMVKYLENIPDDQISSLEIGTGEVYVYDIDHNGKVTSKEIKSTNPEAGKV